MDKDGSATIMDKFSNYFVLGTRLLKLYLLPAIETKYIWTE
jgi:hypothetical protein